MSDRCWIGTNPCSRGADSDKFPGYCGGALVSHTGEKPTLKDVMVEAEDFALRYYLPVLGLGKKATEEEREGVIESLVHFSGLPRAYFERHGLRLSVEDYSERLSTKKVY